MSEYLPIKRPKRSSSDAQERKLAGALAAYTTKGSISYDSEFDAEIRTMQPGWFKSRRNDRRTILLALAAGGAPRPSSTSKNINEKRLGESFNNYVNAGPYRDAAFAHKIRKLAPDWFKDSATIKKRKLVEMASSGKPKPKKNSADCDEQILANALCLYCNSKHRTGYDSNFETKIHQLAPQWFVKKRQPNEYKPQLLQLAANGADKPIRSTNKALACWFYKFTCLKSRHYDAIFTTKIKEVAPLWLEAPRDKTNKMRSKLLEMAKAGVDRPNVTAEDPEERKLYWYLRRLTDSKGTQYDAEFTKQVGSWFWYRELGLNNRPDHKRGLGKYRDFIFDVLKHYNLTTFSNQCEFWTLGGREWHEYKHLTDKGIKFGQGSYHNVNHDVINSYSSDGTCSHSHTEFLQIRQLWKKPAAISYNSVIGLTDSNTVFWQELCKLVIDAARCSGQVLFLWNLIVAYSGTSHSASENELYTKWIRLLRDTTGAEGFDIEFYNKISRRDKPRAKAFTWCCRLFVKTPDSEKRKLETRDNLVKQVYEISDKYPTLGVNGFNTQTAAHRDALIERIDDIAYIAAWLADVRKTRKINSWCESSLTLKGVVEPFMPNRSISHGVFIIGAIVAGFQVKIQNGGPGAQFNFSPKALRGKASKTQENWLYANDINLPALSPVGH
jgi:hypothetical protein